MFHINQTNFASDGGRFSPFTYWNAKRLDHREKVTELNQKMADIQREAYGLPTQENTTETSQNSVGANYISEINKAYFGIDIENEHPDYINSQQGETVETSQNSSETGTMSATEKMLLARRAQNRVPNVVEDTDKTTSPNSENLKPKSSNSESSNSTNANSGNSAPTNNITKNESLKPKGSYYNDLR